ncbi:MAG: hypothetical protein IRZ08_03290, partial [Frankia sp.]|nr:hypothetical protein [Frankia sp.]
MASTTSGPPAGPAGANEAAGAGGPGGAPADARGSVLGGGPVEAGGSVPGGGSAEAGGSVLGGRRISSLLVAVALGGLAGAVVLGRGASPVTLALDEGGGWLANERLGVLFHVNGAAARADATIALPDAAGHELTVLTTVVPTAPAGGARPAGQEPAAGPGGWAGLAALAAGVGPVGPARPASTSPTPGEETVIVLDETSGTVTRVSPALLAITGSVRYPPGTVVTAVGGDAYAVDTAGGRVSRIDPRTLAELGSPVILPAGLGRPAQTPDGTLWVPVPSTGAVVPVRASAAGAPVEAAPPGHTISMTVVADEPVVVDHTAATVARVLPDRVTTPVRLPLAAEPAPSSASPAADAQQTTDAGPTGPGPGGPGAGGPGGMELLVPTRTDGHVLAIVDATAGRLLLVHLATGRVVATALPAIDGAGLDVRPLAPPGDGGDGAPAGPGDAAGEPARTRRLAPPVWHLGRVYVPDSDAGVVWEFDPGSGRFAPPVPVAPAGTGTRIGVTVQGDDLWINDQAGANVVRVAAHGRQPIAVVTQALPGGPRSATPRPLPPGRTPGVDGTGWRERPGGQTSPGQPGQGGPGRDDSRDGNPGAGGGGG